MNQATYPTVTITKAQGGSQDKPVTVVTVLLPIEDYEALIETMDLLADPKAVRTLRETKAGKLEYRALDLEDENLCF